MDHKIASVLGKVLRRLDELANEEYEKKIGHTERWRAIDELIHSDARGDRYELWSLREDQTNKTLASLSIDPENYEYDLKTTRPSILCLVELWRMFKSHEQILKDNSADLWLYCTEDSLPEIDRLSVAWGYQQAEARKRAATAKRAQQAKSRNRRELIEDVIRRFDPGTGTKKSRVATIIKKAEEAKVEGHEKLPIRLDKYLP